MRNESISKFELQISRRIGYTVGLWDLLEFDLVCLPLLGKGNLERNSLVRHIREQLLQRRGQSESAPNEASERTANQPRNATKGKRREPLTGEADGKIDVARALGLLFSPPNLKQYALTPHGRALLALVRLLGKEHQALRAFYLWRVLQCDADSSMTLFMVLATSTESPLQQAFPGLLNDLLKLKYETCLSSPLPLYVKKKTDEILRVRELKPGKTPSRQLALSRGKRPAHSWERIEIDQPEISTYVRHTTGPRKGWLVDLNLLQKVRTEFRTTDHGVRLVEFLRSTSCLQNGYVIIQPDEDVLLDLINSATLFNSAPINHRFFADLISQTFTGKAPRVVELSDREFLEQVRRIYPLVKLARFEQAETAAIREAMELPHLVRGETIEFDRLLESAIRHFPGRISTMSSRRARGAYISLKDS